jgi:hypothetical protein
VGIARRLWDQREEMRRAYEAVHGTDRAWWPLQHPGVVLDAVPSIAHGACLGCQWLAEIRWEPAELARMALI